MSDFVLKSSAANTIRMQSFESTVLNNLKAFFDNLDEKIKNILSGETYLVGGILRDVITGKKEIVDIDLVTPDPQALIGGFSKTMNANVIVLDEQFGVYRLFPRGSGSYIDIAGMQGDNILEDLRRRDFTVNAVAAKYDRGEFRLFDPFSGVDDIKNGIIRKIDRKNFIEDPLRILRAFRFKAELGFEIETETYGDLKALSFLIKDTAYERVKGELLKILKTKQAAACFREMIECGVCEVVFPFLSSYRGFSPGKRHKHDLLEHSLICMSHIEEFQKNGFPIPIDAGLLNRELENDAPVYALCKLAALVHDVGKIFSKNDIKGKLTFYGHESEGEKYIIDFFKKKKFSGQSVEFIGRLVRHHMYPFQIIHSNPDMTVLTPRVYLKIKKELGDFAPFMFNLYIADTTATAGDEEGNEAIEKAKELYKQYKRYENMEKARPPLLDGNEIMEALGISKSPLVGEIIRTLREAELSGKVNSKEEAVNLLKANYESCKQKV